MTSIILPSARPAIVAGLSLVAMETLSDFGAVSFFGINTLTTGIYNSWIAFDDLAFANQLSFYLLIFILALFILENFSRKKAKYHSPSKGGFVNRSKIKLIGKKSFYATLTLILLPYYPVNTKSSVNYLSFYIFSILITIIVVIITN